MRKIGLIILVATVAISLANLAYAQAVTAVKETPNKPTGASDVFKKPEIAKPAPDGEQMEQPTVSQALPPGIAKRDDGDIPGEGKHLGWTQGQHKGWDNASQEISADERAAVGDIEAVLDRLNSAIEELKLGDKLGDWLNQKPSFGITEEGGVDGYRQAVKNWLDTCPDVGLSDVIKEITASL